MIDRSLNYGRPLIRRFLQAASQYSSVLDIGAGSGSDLRLARDVCPRATLHAVDCLPTHGPVLQSIGAAVHLLNIERDSLPFEDESIDVIVCNQILEHCKELFWIWHEMTRVLRTGGSIIVGVPNLASLHNRMLLLFARQPTPIQSASAHVRGFTRHDLAQFLDTCFPNGYSLQQWGGSNFYPLPPLLARPLARLLPGMAWGLFMMFRKNANYHRQFIDYPSAVGLETNFYTGPP